MKLRELRNLVLGLALAGAASLVGTVTASANCEGITNAFAYNECLAKQGPQRGTARAPRAPRGVDPEATVRGKARYSPSRESVGSAGASGIVISRQRGRTSAVIDPWSAVKRGFSGPSPRGRRRR